MSLDTCVKQSQALMDALEFEQALEVLTPEAARLQALPASESHASMEALLLGLMATCHLHLGRAENSLPLLQPVRGPDWYKMDIQALVICLGALFETHRYLGHTKEAAEAANMLAWALHETGRERKLQADRLDKLVNLLRHGEPLNRVVVDCEGVTRELAELGGGVKVSLRFSFCRNRMDLAPALARVQRGRELARQERFEEALALFREAGPLDPHSPDPRYEGAATLLHLQRASEAVAWYDETEALAPGWYDCRARRWLAAAIAEGRVPHQTFLSLHALERPNLDGEERLHLAREGLRVAPGVPEFQWHLGRQLVALGREEEAREAFAAGLQQAQEPDVRSRLLVESAALIAPSAERTQQLQEAMAPGGHLIAAAMAAVMLRTGPAQRPDPQRADSTRYCKVFHKHHPTREELQMLAGFESNYEPVPKQYQPLADHVSVCDDCAATYSASVVPSRWR